MPTVIARLARDAITETDLIDRALAEDVGDGDVTTVATVDAEARGAGDDHAEGAGRDLRARRRRGGVPAARSRRARSSGSAPEGEWREGGPVLRVEGSARALLTAERTALNFLGRLSGVATKTARVVRAVGRRRRAKILDTRKTTPGLRVLEKRAVAHGGGVNHRIGLFDFILIKENHAELAGGVGEAVRRARAARPDLPLAVEVRDAARDRRGARGAARRGCCSTT